MSKHEPTLHDDQALTKAAWEKFQKQLDNEPVNQQWHTWSIQHEEGRNPLQGLSLIEHSTNSQEDADYSTKPVFSSLTGSGISLKSTPADRNSFRFRTKQRRRWIGGLAAASVLVVTLASPVGNQVLATVLNQFQTKQLVAVDQADLRQVMDQIFYGQEPGKAINRFGTFTNKPGKLQGDFTLSEAEQALGHKLAMPSDFDEKQRKIHIYPQNEITLKLNVTEINKMIKRLGSEKLLPSSVDGKPITLIFGDTANINIDLEQNGVNKYYSFTQQAAPMLIVDPSIPVADALNALMNNPLLPVGIKDKLSGALENGNIPLPVITDGAAEKYTEDGIDVILNSNAVQQKTSYSAYWIKNGQLFILNGNCFVDKAAVKAKITELIRQ